jgi:hypothetical protein
LLSKLTGVGVAGQSGTGGASSITAVPSPRICLLRMPVLIAVFLWRPSPVIIVWTVLAALQVWIAIKYRSDSPQGQIYYAVSAAIRVEYALYYLGAVIFLSVMT